MAVNGTTRKVVKKAIAKQDKEMLAAKLTSEELQEEIRVKAYELYLRRGAGPGNAVEDWVAAEQIILKKISF